MKAVRVDHSTRALPRLPFWADVFVTLIYITILALSGWREWTSRDIDMKNAEADMANLR